MRVFICAFSGFSLAIPMRSVSSLTLHEHEAAQTVEYNMENRNTYVSLPHLFSLPSELIRHGLVLKSLISGNGDREDGNIEDDNIIENKIILLTTEVKCETEIPGEDIFPIPKTLGTIRFSALFNGIRFDTNDVSDTSGKPILFLNTGNLVQIIQKEAAA